MSAFSDSMQKKRAVHRSGWFVLLAVFVAILWHLLWMNWLSPQGLQVAHFSHKEPEVMYFAGRNGQEDVRALRAIWSPVMFALPSMEGYSRSTLERKISVRPPLDRPPASAMYLKKQAEDEYRMSTRHMDRVLQGLMDKQLNALPSRRAEERPFKVVSRDDPSIVLSIMSDDFDLKEFSDWPSSQTPIDLKDEAWEAEIQLDVDKFGLVQHAYLVTPTDAPSRNAALLRAMYVWRFSEASASRYGLVQLSYLGKSMVHEDVSAWWLP